MKEQTDKNCAFNSERKRVNRNALISVLLAAVIIVTIFAGYFVRGTVEPEESREMSAIMRLLKENSIYVSEESAEESSSEFLQIDELSSQFVQKVIAPYDPYAKYYSPQEYKRLLEEDNGRYSGVGIGISEDRTTETISVTRVYLNSPAYKSGMKEQDVLLGGIKKGDTEYTYFKTAVLEFNQDKPESEKVSVLSIINEFFAGFEVGDEVKLKIWRGDGEMEFTLIKEDYVVSYVEYKDNEKAYYFSTEDDGFKGRESSDEDMILPSLSDDTGYIKLYEFEGDAAEQFEEALEYMNTERNKTKLILDLRDNGGGIIDILLKIASHLINNVGESKIRVLNYTDKNASSYYSTTNRFNPDFLTDISVIANAGTASAAECLIGALMDYGDSETYHGAQFGAYRLVLTPKRNASGDEFYRTYGKGIMQTTYALSSGGALKLTTAKISWPVSKKCIQGEGIVSTIHESDAHAILRADAVLH